MTTTPYALSRTTAHRPIHSRRGALAAIVLLLALPLAILTQIIVGFDAEVVVHFALATGTFLIASSVFDFATPRWLSWTAAIAAFTVGSIFLLQGLSGLVANDSLRVFAYSLEVGGWGEMASVSLIMAWFAAVARAHTHGLTRIIGIASSFLVIGLAIWSITFAPAMGTPQGLRLLFLLPIAWFVFVSTRATTSVRRSTAHAFAGGRSFSPRSRY